MVRFTDKKIPNFQWSLTVSYRLLSNKNGYLEANLNLYDGSGKTIICLPAPCKVTICLINNSGQRVSQTPFKCFPINSKLPLQYSPLLPETQQDMKNVLPGGNLTVYCEIEMLTPRKLLSIVSSQFAPHLQSKSKNRLLHDLFDRKKLSDVTFHIDDKKIQAHKLILSTRSSVFEAMFSHDTKEKLTNRVEVVDVDAGVFEEVLRLIYTNEVDSTLLKDRTIELMVAADKYMLDDLKILCRQQVLDSLSIENVLDYFVSVQRYSIDDLNEEIFSIMRKNFVELVLTAKWGKVKENLSRCMCEILNVVYSGEDVNGLPTKKSTQK